MACFETMEGAAPLANFVKNGICKCGSSISNMLKVFSSLESFGNEMDGLNMCQSCKLYAFVRVLSFATSDCFNTLVTFFNSMIPNQKLGDMTRCIMASYASWISSFCSNGRMQCLPELGKLDNSTFSLSCNSTTDSIDPNWQCPTGCASAIQATQPWGPGNCCAATIASPAFSQFH